MTKLAPWLLSVALAALLGFTYFGTSKTIAERDAQIEQLKQQSVQLATEANAKIAEANVKTHEIATLADAKLKQLAEEAGKQIEAANLKEVQVKVAFRKALLSSGLVVTIANTSGQTIAVSASISRPPNAGGIVRELTIDSGQTVEIGQREGWAFLSGDIIKIDQAQHKPLTFTAP